MAQEHFDRLTAIDASFLAQEDESAHMHVGGVAVFEGPPPPFEDVLDLIRGRLHLVPRYRQRLAFPPMDTARPVWVDDPDFNILYHVRQTALPSPGDQRQLLRLVSRVFSQQLDRDRPLWEMWMVEGLEGDRWALLSKTHHALIDGVSGVDLATVLFDLSPEGTEIRHPEEPWEPARAPGASTLIASGLLSATRAVVNSVRDVVSTVTNPQYAFDGVRDGVQGLAEFAWAGANPSPDNPLNVPIGPHRHFRVVKANLADFKEIKNSLGGTVNDAVLAVVSGALRTWLISRGVRTEGLELKAEVPVSVRSEHEHHQLGNRITAMSAPLPIYIEDPEARLAVVRKSMDDLKSSKQALGAEVIAGAMNFTAPTILAQASRLNFSTRLFNLIVTNVPGPQFPLYVEGRRLLEIFPVAFLPNNHALAIAIMSYDGELNFGLLGDYDAMHDIDVVADGLRDSIDELLAISATASAAETEPV